MTKKARVGSVAEEFREAQLGDVRLVKRATSIVRRLEVAPAFGFPQALKTGSATEAFYRFLRNPRVRYRALVDSHAAETVSRISPGSTVRVVHDTTEVSFSGESRAGLGRLRSGDSVQGFLAHASLVLSADRFSKPLGVVGLYCWTRAKAPRSTRKMAGSELAKHADRESKRWPGQVKKVESLVSGRGSVIHLMDREGDAYPLLNMLVEDGLRFVVRMARDRKVLRLTGDNEPDEDLCKLSEELNRMSMVVVREVPLSRRASSTVPGTRKLHPERASRTARLLVRSGRVALRRPKYFDDELAQSLMVNVVYVQEIDPPKGEEPIVWVLATSESVERPADVEAVLDHYRARWNIEEFFKALKTGCALETRQLESFQTLTNALALFVPIAWQMLLLRALSRETPDAPADQVLTPTQIQVLQHEQPQKMPASGATVRHALYAVAAMGGHLKSNGPPGWLTLARGMQTLTTLAQAWENAWAAMKKQPKTPRGCDQ
jgi:Transposase DNA-binding/Transposase DDE domain